MRLMLFALPLLAATAAVAQSSTQKTGPASSTTLPAHIAVSGNCPVGMFAQRRDSGQTLWTTSFEDENKPQKVKPLQPGNTGVHVELDSHDKAVIRQVELAVYFVAPGTRALPVASTGAPADLRKTFNLSADNGASLKLRADLLVGPAGGITRVHVLSIDYTDGTSWHAKSDSACSVEPSRFILVNAR